MTFMDAAAIDRFISTKVVPAMERRLDRAADHITTTMRHLVSGPSPSEPGNPPGMDSGNLRSHLTWWKPAPLVRRIGVQDKTEVPYVLVLEGRRGPTTIYPTHGRFLAIPKSEMAKAHKRGGGGPLTFPADLRLVARQRGPWQLRDRQTDEEHYMLVESVTIQPRPFMGPAMGITRAQVRDILTTGT